MCTTGRTSPLDTHVHNRKNITAWHTCAQQEEHCLTHMCTTGRSPLDTHVHNRKNITALCTHVLDNMCTTGRTSLLVHMCVTTGDVFHRLCTHVHNSDVHHRCAHACVTTVMFISACAHMCHNSDIFHRLCTHVHNSEEHHRLAHMCVKQ